MSETIITTYGIRKPYILSVGHLLGFRNIVELVEAFAILKGYASCEIFDLVIVGQEQLPGYLKRIKSSIRKHKLDDSVHILGEIPHYNVGVLLKGCVAFVFSSTCENCPTSLIEAMSLRVPIACSCIDPMPEIAGDAVLYFDPRDPFDIACSMKKLIDNPLLRVSLQDRAYQRSRRFPTRLEVATQTFDVLKGIAQHK